VKVLIFDLEIKKAIPSRNQPNLDGIDYCDGWGDHKGMGIACVGALMQSDAVVIEPVVGDWDEFKWQCNLTENFKGFKKVGFNSKAFDDKVLRAAGLTQWYTDYDLLEEIRIAAGHNPIKAPSGWKYNLEAMAAANSMVKDSAVSAIAPILWQQGERQQVLDQCAGDVAVTAALLNLGLAGELIDPNTGKKLQLSPV
jgi:hypothetical protein